MSGKGRINFAMCGKQRPILWITNILYKREPCNQSGQNICLLSLQNQCSICSLKVFDKNRMGRGKILARKSFGGMYSFWMTCYASFIEFMWWYTGKPTNVQRKIFDGLPTGVKAADNHPTKAKSQKNDIRKQRAIKQVCLLLMPSQQQLRWLYFQDQHTYEDTDLDVNWQASSFSSGNSCSPRNSTLPEVHWPPNPQIAFSEACPGDLYRVQSTYIRTWFPPRNHFHAGYFS